MNIISQKINYAAYMLVFIVAFIGNSAHATNAISSIEIATTAHTVCDNFKQALKGVSIGSFYWPTDRIEINITSKCMSTFLQPILNKALSEAGLLHYVVATNTTKVYIDTPEVRLINSGIQVRLRIDGWFRGKTGIGFTPKNYYSLIVLQNFSVGIRNGQIKLLLGPVFPAIQLEGFPKFVDDAATAFAFIGLNFSELFANFIATITGNTNVDLPNTLIQSTSIVDVYEKVTGLSDAEPRVRQILVGSSFDLSIDPDYFRLSLSPSSLNENAKKDFVSIAKKASNGLLTDADANSIFSAIRYPQGPSALNLLVGRGIGHENNQAPTAFQLSQQVNFNKSIDFTPKTSDPENDPLSYSFLKLPSHGKLYTLNNGKFRLRYESFKDFSGADRFVYQINDPYGLSDTGVVNLVVNPNRPPIALSSGVKVNWNEEVTFVPNRATDPEGDNLSYSVSKKPSNGRVESVLGGRRLQYIPNKDYSGRDRFEYKVEDPYGLFATGLVDVVVTRIGVTLGVVNIGKGKGVISSNPDGIDCGPYCTEDFGSFSGVTLTAIPDPGFVFSGWGNSSSCISAGTGSCTLTMNTSRFVNARFDIAPTSFTLTVNKTGTGSGIVTSNAEGIDCGDDCTEDYIAGANTQVTLTPAPEAGSTFRGWTGACSGKGACIVIMSQVRNVGVIFETAIPTIFTVNNLNDSGMGSLRQAINNANANPGNDSIFFQTELNGTIVLATGQLTITDSVVLHGPGAKTLAISGNNISRIFVIGPGTLGTVDISGLTLKQGNDTSGNGGAGIYIDSGTVTISECTLTANSAKVGGGGGGIRKFGMGWLKIINTTISGNSALDEFGQGDGGGIRNDQDTLTISNSTVSGNSAANGGGILFDDGRLTVSNSTITSNSAVNGGGGIVTFSGDLFLENNVIAGNTAPIDKEIQNVGGTTHSLGYNLFGTNGVSGVTGGITLSTKDLILTGAITTAIGSLADNGGSTKTHFPVVGSAAVDAGNNLLIPLGLNDDQRGIGFPRILNGKVDIGAVEKIGKHTLRVSKKGGNGVITSKPAGINCGKICTYAFTENSPVTLTVAADSVSIFTGWSGSCSSIKTCQVKLTKNMNVIANFKKRLQFPISITKTGLGTVTSSPVGINCGSICSKSYFSDTKLTLTATPKLGKSFVQWKGLCTGVKRICTVTILKASSVTAIFK